jgi:hypothetical protein
MSPPAKKRPPEAAATASEGAEGRASKLWRESPENRSACKDSLSRASLVLAGVSGDSLGGPFVNFDASMWSGRGGGDAARSRAAPRAPALPCQNRNNSTEGGYRLSRKTGASEPVDHAGRVWDERADGWFTVAELSGAERKAAFKLRQNVQGFVSHWGRNHCAFFTLTDEAGLHPKGFARRWNSFLTHEGGFIRAFCRVVEPQRNGRPHYHLLVSVPWDMRPESFDWEAFFEAQQEFRAAGRSPRFRELTRRYRDSAGPETVAVWKRLRKVLPKYGLGRSEFLPVRKGHEALSEYVGKYLEAGLSLKRHNWKGVRRVETDRRTSSQWRRCSGQFSWVSEGARAWRGRIGQLATECRCSSLDEMSAKFGARWVWRMRVAILTCDEDAWADVVRSVASSVDPRPYRLEVHFQTPPRLPVDFGDRARARALAEECFVCVGDGGDAVPEPAFKVRGSWSTAGRAWRGQHRNCDAKQGPPATN